MTAKSGSHSIGPHAGQLIVKTYVGGMGAKMGHDLVMEATRWSGTVSVNADNPSACSVQISVDPRSLEVRQATGGIKPLSDKDRSDIGENRDKTLGASKFPEIRFESTRVSGYPPRLSLQGNLTIAGNSRPVTLDVSVEDGSSETRLSGRTTVTQTAFGVKPYSKLGALKIKDDVDIEFSVSLPSA